jgi:uncharacterized protein YciI
MWIHEVAFDLANDEERLALRGQHRDRLAVLHADGIVPYAGPLAGGAGAVVLWDLPDARSVREMLARDPYYGAPSITEVSLREWDLLAL